MCGFQVISNLASIVTLVLFVAYIIGRIIIINRVKETMSEKYQFEENFDFNGPKPKHFYKLSKNGEVFSVSAPVGIKELRIYKAKLMLNQCEAIKGDFVEKLIDIKPNEKAYIMIDIPDLYEGCFIDIEKKDGIVISFGVASSGYDGSLVQTNYSLKIKKKSWIYYICI